VTVTVPPPPPAPPTVAGAPARRAEATTGVRAFPSAALPNRVFGEGRSPIYDYSCVSLRALFVSVSLSLSLYLYLSVSLYFNVSLYLIF
jgi:hypothetical protein